MYAVVGPLPFLPDSSPSESVIGGKQSHALQTLFAHCISITCLLALGRGGGGPRKVRMPEGDLCLNILLSLCGHSCAWLLVTTFRNLAFKMYF